MSSRIKCGVRGPMYSGSGLRGILLRIILRRFSCPPSGSQEKRMLGRSISCVRATSYASALYPLESRVDIACGSAVEAFKSTIGGLH
jgi:hypothetical protein